ncbi:MAG: DUF4932 domain-containing protein [Candidatus Riflebacteria bacterium]|nr:DUF4932 domain-containing protein [Candidatus Riflebacteria bacterium]
MPTISSHFDSRIELLSIIFRLSGTYEYNQCHVASYSEAIDKHFKKFSDHKMVKFARKMIRNHGAGYNAPMSLAIHLKDTSTLDFIVPLNPWPKEFDTRWSAETAQEFAVLAKQFIKETDFDGFIKSQKPVYDYAEKEIKKHIENNVKSDWFGKFFGKPMNCDLCIIPALVNGGNSYGLTLYKPDATIFFCILGAWKCDSSGNVLYDDEYNSVIIHEFSHSYFYSFMDKHIQLFEKSGKSIFSSCKGLMEMRSYGSWEAIINESLVRAASIQYFIDNNDNEAAERAIEDCINNGFSWIRAIVEKYADYQSNRDKYPTFEDFTPQLVQTFEKCAEKLADEDAKRPQIVAMDPPNHFREVEPGYYELRVTFNMPMQPGYSWCQNGDNFPKNAEGKKPFWTDDKKTCVFPAMLEPNNEFELYLNTIHFQGFVGENDLPLKPVYYWFQTGEPGISKEHDVKIVKMEPENGATDVDPKLTEIRATFDQEMKSPYSWCTGNSNFPDYPPDSKVYWTDDKRTCVVPVILKPGSKYQFSLNSEDYSSFQSKKGKVLKPYLYEFSTRK